MGSGFLHSQGGAYPVSQHENNVGALTSPQDNNFAPVNGIQHNMIATEYPGDGQVCYSLTQWQQGNIYSKKNVKGLHQLESLASILRTGCQQATHGDCEGGPWDSCSQINSVLSSKCRTSLSTSPVENSVKRLVYNGESKSLCSKGKGSNMCINTEKDIGAAAHPSSAQHLLKTCPLLTSILTGIPAFEILRGALSSQSEKTNGKMKLNTSPPFSDGHLKSRQAKSSLAAPNCEKTIPQDPLEVMHSSLSPSHQPSAEKVSPFGEMMPLTDEQILELIEKQVAHYRNILTESNGKCGHTNVRKELDWCSNLTDFTFQFDSMPTSNSAVHLPPTPPTVREDAAKPSPSRAMIEKCTTAVAQALWYSSEDTRAHNKLFPKSENTECPQIKRNVAATCPKTEDESPVVLTSVFGMTLDELTENYPSPLLNCNSSQGESKFLGQEVEVSPDWIFNISKNLDNMEERSVQTLDLDHPWTIKHTMEREKLDTGLKPVEAVGLESLQSVTTVSEYRQTKSRSEVSKNTEIGPISLIESQETKIENIEDHQDFALVDAYSEHSTIQIHNVVSLVKDETAISESDEAFSMKPLRVAQYEDISDDENMSQLTIKLPNTQHVEFRTSACYEPHHENMSSLLKDDNTDYLLDDDWLIFPISISDLKREDEDQCRSSPTAFCVLDDAETGDKETQRDTSPAHSEPHRAAPPFFSLIEEFDTKESFQEAMRLRNVNMLEAAPGFYSPEHEPDSEGELHSPQKKRGSYSELEDSSDTEDSCNYPCGSEGNHMTVFSKVLAPLAPDTVDSGSEKDDDEVANVQKSLTRNVNMVKEVAKKIRELSKNVSKHHQNDREEAKGTILISLGTYSSGNANCSRQNKLLRETEDSSYGGKEKFKKTGLPSTDLPAPQHQSMHCDQHKRQKISREESVIIIISSDSEDDLDQNYTKAKKRKGMVSSRSLEEIDTQCAQQKIDPPTTVNSVHRQASPAQHQSERHDTHLKEVMHGACSGQPHSPEESKQLTEAKDDTAHREHKTNRLRFSRKRRVRRILSLESEDSDDILFATKSRQKTDTKSVDSRGTANKMPKTKRLSSKNFTKKQTHSATKEVDSSLGTNRVISCLVVQKSSPDTSYLTLVKESGVHMQGNEGPPAPKIPTEPRKKTEKSHLHVNRPENGYCVSKPKPAMDRQHSTKNKEQAKVAKTRLDSSQLSSPSQVGSSTCTGNSSTSRQQSEVGQSSSRGLPQSDITSTRFRVPKSLRQQSSSNQQPSRFDSKSSTLDLFHTLTKDPSSSATTLPPAREEVRKIWEETFFPTRRDRKSSLRIEEESPTHENLCREARPGPSTRHKLPKSRHSSHKSETPLMRKSKSDAIQVTKARHLDTPSKQSTVGENYKWSEKPRVAKATKRS